MMHSYKTALALGAILLGSAGLVACGGGNGTANGGNSNPTPTPTPVAFSPLEINIAHINDHHSQLESFAAQTLKLDGIDTQVDLGGFARVTSAFKEAAGKKNLLKLHAGDALTGTLYYTFFKGKADAQLMNTVCFDAFALGNHEFDDGDTVLKGFINELQAGSCKTPVLSANIEPAAGTPLLPAAGQALFKPYTIKTYEGIKVGIIGLTISGKTVNSSRPLDSTRFLDEAASAQRYIDELKGQGIRHIVLLTHQGYENDKALAAKLTDVDVIIGGDSHSLLGDFSALGVASSGTYPSMVKNKDGQTVCIGQAGEYAKAFGLMNVKFNPQGAIEQCQGQASLLVGGTFKRKDANGQFVAMSATDQATLTSKLASVPAVKVIAPDSAAATLLSGYTSKVNEEKAKQIGSTTDALCLVRVPGESTNRSAGVTGCESANTLARGSDIAQIVAEAFLDASKRSQIALQNAGGVRVPVAAGTLTMNTAFTILPFTNVLVEMNLKGSEIVQALEDSVANHLDNKQSDGSQPYAAGLRWDLDMSKPAGSRFSNVQVRDRKTGIWSPIEANREYILVTNDFIAAGKDGYTALGKAYAEGRYINTYLLYTQSFADYVQKKATVTRPLRSEYSHQKVTTKAGVLLP
ncbi:bifunctional metallophosphatase/5'-nucleotidase [Chitinilyticum aquatile]|uniref:bifunctional metallophosphatase/5'-nucleotidase n=1 Tax=Chitinilyticum aquatile TaxID=362520 RepID=UPI001B7F9211|nr:5'-nucleotidase C-terminal domain-containing protein [Chitinilyticum aquatile]